VAEMTRQEMADVCERVAAIVDHARLDGQELTEATQLKAAAAELRKNCAGCEHFRHHKGGDTPFGEVKPFGVCRGRRMLILGTGTISVPADGSGHCHEWSAK